jgi:hypothetical protein
MYLRTTEERRLGLGQPIQPLLTTFTSRTIIYKDKDGDDKCRLTKCSVYVPKLLRYSQAMDLLVFFHGHDTCKQHKFDPEQVIKNFRLDDQVEATAHPVALAVPSLFWKVSDSTNIRSAWSAAYMNAFVGEVLDQIALASSSFRPNLQGLILAGHSGAYDILTPLSDQFDCRAPDTQRDALAKLKAVIAMDTTYGLQHAKALEKWAINLPGRRFTLVLSKDGTPPYVWKLWEGMRKKTKGFLPVRPGNLDVKPMGKDGHCALPAKYLTYFI